MVARDSRRQDRGGVARASLDLVHFRHLENEFAGKGYGDFKASVAEVVVEYFRPIRQHALDLLSDEKHLLDILHAGSAKAREVASSTLAATYKGLGVVS